MARRAASEVDGRPVPDRRRALEALLGERVVDLRDVTPAWETGTQTGIATLRRGDRVVAQWPRDRRGLSRRLRLARVLPAVAPWIPVTEVLGGDAGAPDPVLVTRFVPGESGREWLSNDDGAALLGRRMGVLAAGLRRVPTRGLRLSTLWGDPERLAAAAHRWLADGGATLGAAGAAAMERLLVRVPAELGDAPPVFAHGDFAPVNVLVRDGAVVALLDFERARIAHPLFDAAWWRCIVRHHHPDRWEAAGPAFLRAAGLGLDAGTVARLDLLAALQLMEQLHETPRRQVATRAGWAARLAAELGRQPRAGTDPLGRGRQPRAGADPLGIGPQPRARG